MKNLIFTLLLLCSASFSFAQNVPAYVPTNGLVGWWPFNGNANDESGNGNNGTVNGAILTADRNGQVNKAYSFDGVDDLIECGNSIVLPNYSFSSWVNSSDFPVLGYSIVSKISTNFENSELRIWNDSSFSIAHGTGSTWASLQSSNSITINQWLHLVATFDGNNISLFLNGVPSGTVQVNGFIDVSGFDLYFGARPNTQGISTTSLFMNGKLDDIGIWNRALTPQEISDLYNAVNCANNLSISPTQNSVQRGNTATFTATTSDPNPTIIWQSDFGQGFQTLNNVGNYSGTNNATLNIANVQLSEHNQPVRAISTSGNCVDTSAVSVINVLDTCVTTVFDTITTFISVTDTLIINAVISSVNPPNNVNTLLIYPNPANTHITIDNGNFATMAGYSVRINNALGQLVFNQNITQQQFFIDLSTWTGPGLYYVNILDPNGNPIEVKKIVIQ
jgi:hypothetical protein